MQAPSARELLLQQLGIVCGDVIDSQVDEVAHILAFVDCPYVYLEAEVVGLLHPLGVLAQDLARVVNARQSEVTNALRGQVAVQVEDPCVGCDLAEGEAGVCLLYTSPSPRD